MMAHAANNPDEMSKSTKPGISLPVFDAINNAYAMASADPVTSKIVISLRLLSIERDIFGGALFFNIAVFYLTVFFSWSGRGC